MISPRSELSSADSFDFQHQVHHCNDSIQSGPPNSHQNAHGNETAYNDFEKQRLFSFCSLWFSTLTRNLEPRNHKGTGALVRVGSRVEAVKRLYKGLTAFSKAGLGGGWEEDTRCRDQPINTTHLSHFILDDSSHVFLPTTLY